MSVAIIRTATPRPSIDELAARASDLASFLRGRAERTEADRMVSPEAIAMMREAGLFRVMQPAIYGGYEYGFDGLIRTTAPVAAGCGSSGWVYGLVACHQWLMATYPKPMQDEFWADPDAVAAGSYAPVGKAVAADGGYRLSGSWSFTSSCDHAQWLFHGGMLAPAREGERPTPMLFVLPRSDVRIDDNWFTMGLAGTGSKNSVATDAFVPAHRAMKVADLLAGTTPGAAVHANPLYRQSMLAGIPFTLVAPILGMAEGGLADFIDMVKVRTTRGAVAGGNNRMADYATIQSRVAEATGSIDAARLTIFHAIEQVTLAAEAGTQADLDLRLRNRLSQAFSTRLLVQAVDALFLASGGQGIYTSKPLQRIWRDAHAAAVHVSLNWDAVSTMYGQYVLGLDPKGQY